MISTMTQPPEVQTLSQMALSPNNGVNDKPSEKFPSFEDARPPYSLPAVTESPLEATPGQSIIPEYKWPARRSSQVRKDLPSGHHGHRSRRSVSDALNRIRARQGSVSENAQELAEALKAPVSYKLIVRSWKFRQDLILTLFRFYVLCGI